MLKTAPAAPAVMTCVTAGLPMNPAGASVIGFHVRNGVPGAGARTLAKLQGAARHPTSLVKLIVPAALATNVLVPYGVVTVYSAPGVRPAVTRTR